MDQIVETVSSFDGALVVVADEASGYPTSAWGDAFFFFAPDGLVPERTQPYGTIVTKDSPGDQASRLDAHGRFRVNIHVGRDRAAQLIAHEALPDDVDAFIAHPLYGSAGWVAVVNPGASTAEATIALLRDAHDATRDRAARRSRPK